MKLFIREIFISMILSLLFIFILSIIVSSTTVPEKVIIPAVMLITATSLMIGAFRISKNKKEKGILNGAILGFLYMLVLYVISSFIAFDFSLSMNSIIMVFLGIVGGVIGGIVGVNF